MFEKNFENKANLFYPVQHTQAGPPPLVVKAITKALPAETIGGVMVTADRPEFYILLSALPTELQQKVHLAIQAIQTAI